MACVVAAGALLVGCQDNGNDATDMVPLAPVPLVVTSPPTEFRYADDVRGLRLNRSIVVRGTPALDGEKLGTVAAHTIVGWQQTKIAAGCEGRWVEIRPQGWVCDRYLDPSSESPQGFELPKLRFAQIMPGKYGKVVAEDAQLVTIENGVITGQTPIVGSTTYRKRGGTVVDDVYYWRVKDGRYIAEDDLRIHRPSGFRGTAIEDFPEGSEILTGFAYSAKRPGDWVVVRDAPGGTRTRRLAARQAVVARARIHDESGAVVAYQIGDGEFISAADVRIGEIQPRPEGVLADERWIDVDLDSQVLVAYRGDVPVYTTLVSAGTNKNPTQLGQFRIWIKFSETSMSGRMGEEDAYSVATVPWTQFYDNDFALHSSYWHDAFGEKRSHGCVNLSPMDARFLYFWSAPQVPIGWSMANSSSANKGSLVQIRSPKFKAAQAQAENK